MWVFIGLAAATAVIILLSRSQIEKNRQLKSINSFSACQAAGYPIMESYPRQCSLPNGKFFVESTILIECQTQQDCPAGTICKNHACQKQ